jgi:hypothetical protein
VNPNPLEWRSAYEECPEICGHLHHPGMNAEPRFLDASGKATTADQAAIEGIMESRGVDGQAILHVGVGNSSLAKRFAGSANRITGVTLSENERDLAQSLGLPRYTVHVANKYSPRTMIFMNPDYDLIVDNNLASFACCRFHFYTMLNNYVLLLKPGGQILTHEKGMNWAAGDPRWKLVFADLKALEVKFPLRASYETDGVYSLTKLP